MTAPPTHPLQRLTPLGRRQWSRVLIVGTVGVLLALTLVGRPLSTPAAPLGIISFEFIGSPARAEALLAEWDARTRQAAALSLGLDYLFMPLYSSLFALWCVQAARRRSGAWATAGLWLAWGQWGAAALDAVENVALAQVLWESPTAVWPPLAAACAAGKFGLLAAALLYVLGGRLVSAPSPPE